MFLQRYVRLSIRGANRLALELPLQNCDEMLGNDLRFQGTNTKGSQSFSKATCRRGHKLVTEIDPVRFWLRQGGGSQRGAPLRCNADPAPILVVLQTWQPEASQSWVAPIMRWLESRIAPLRTDAVQQSPPWVTTGPDLSESCAPFRFLESFSKRRRRIGILD